MVSGKRWHADGRRRLYSVSYEKNSNVHVRQSSSSTSKKRGGTVEIILHACKISARECVPALPRRCRDFDGNMESGREYGLLAYGGQFVAW